MSAAKLDCVVIGYSTGDFHDYASVSRHAGKDSPEWQIFNREHLIVGGEPVPWLDAFSAVRNQRHGGDHRYHVAEVPNLAAFYLTNYLRRSGVSAEAISLFDAECNELSDILRESPRVAAITTTFYVSVLPIMPVVELIRQLSPETLIVIGGPFVDNLCINGVNENATELFDAIGADIYVRESQGELALSQICQAVGAGAERFERIDNLIVRASDQETWIETRREAEKNDLDEVWIDWRQFGPDRIGETAQVRTARSCAFKCSFCDYPSRAGALSLASIDTVRRELQTLADIGVRNVVFVDDTFNVPPKRFKALCQMMIEEEFGFSWYSYFRCSNARDEESFELAAASGCAGVFLGIESADDGVLQVMNKLAQDAQYRVGLTQLKSRGIDTFASIVVGFPGETAASVQKTHAFLEETQPTFWRAQPWWANPRSPIFRDKDLHGIQGTAYSWKHNTMDSTEAAALCDQLFAQVRGSTWLPLYEFDFWALPYLRGKGLSHTALESLLHISNDYNKLGKDVTTGPYFDAVNALELAPPKYRY
jgi:radical SAM PhpK family P-methyltransferase